MKGQTRACIPAVIGIALLLAGISGYLVTSGQPQATVIAESTLVQSCDECHTLMLAREFRADADEAVRQTGAAIAAELRGEQQARPTQLAADWPRPKRVVIGPEQG